VVCVCVWGGGVCYNHCHGNVCKGFLVLRDNFYDCTFTVLDFSSFLTGNLLVIITVLIISVYHVRKHSNEEVH
jgi:hypothetical protein